MADIPAVVAVNRIDGKILPGTIFTPANQEQHDDLLKLGAIRAPTEAEAALHEKMQANVAATHKNPIIEAVEEAAHEIETVVEEAVHAIEGAADSAIS